MDHLLYPIGTDVPPLQIPILCDHDDDPDGCSFTDFPYRRGWASESNNLGWLQCSDEALARRVQIWLYFGLLSAFCGCNVSKAYLSGVDEMTGCRYLSTARLHHLLDKRKSLNDGQSMLREALQYSELVEQRVKSSLGSLHLISCSIRVLLQTLNSTQGLQITAIKSTQRYHIGQRWPLKWSQGLFDGWSIPPAKAILYRMAALGWCPAKVLDLSHKYSCSTLYYVSGLPVDQSIDHSRCTESGCIACNIDESIYVPRHTQACREQNCSLVETASFDVSSIIEDGLGIPLMSCSVNPDGHMQSRLARAEPRQEYFAISHV